MGDGNISAENGDVVCAGCRQPGDAQDLERFVYHDRTGLLYDMRGGAPGEAVWVHPLWGCLRAACWAGFARELSQSFDDVDAPSLYDDLTDGVHRRLRETLTDAARLDEVVVGWSPVVELAESSGGLELVLADPGRDDGEVDAIPGDVEVFEAMRPGTLSEAFGRPVAAVGVPAGSRAQTIGRIAEKLVCLQSDVPEDRDEKVGAVTP